MFYYSETDRIVLPIAAAAILLTGIVLGLLLRGKSPKIKNIPLQLISIAILTLEIIKQVRNLGDNFNTYALPLHYCSLFVFLFPLAELCGKRLRKIFKPAAFAAALTMTFFFHFSPQLIISNSTETLFRDFSSFHSFFFHELVMLYTVLSIALNCYIPKKRDAISVMLIMAVYVSIAAPAAHILNTNYCDFLFSNIPQLEWLRDIGGYVPYTLAVAIGVSPGTALFSLVYAAIYQSISKKLGGKKS